MPATKHARGPSRVHHFYGAHRIGLTLYSAVAEGIASSGLHPREQRQHRLETAPVFKALCTAQKTIPSARGAVKLRVRHALGRASCRSSA